jgi:hypothetical protein
MRLHKAIAERGMASSLPRSANISETANHPLASSLISRPVYHGEWERTYYLFSFLIGKE